MAEFKLGRIRFIWKGDWVSGTTYVKDDIVRLNGKTYICVIGHTADANFYTDFDNIPTRWNQISDGSKWRGDWTTDTEYFLNDLVKYGGNIYLCTTGHTSSVTSVLGLEADQDLPSQTNSKWDIFAEGFDWKASWLTNTRYKVNDIVRYGGISYVCNEGHTSSLTSSAGLEADLSKWDIYAETFDWKGNWLVNTRYKRNDIVRYGGTTYICNYGHTSAASETLGLEDDQGYWDYFNKGLEYKTTWSPSSVRYKVNDIVKYGAGLWICVTDHTSSATFAEGNWAQFVEALEFENSWDPATSYQHGDVVTYGGYIYVSITTNNLNQKPTSNSDDWDLVTTGFSFQGDWTTSAYKVGDVVRLNGYTYLAIADNTNQQPPNLTYWSRLNYGVKWRGNWVDDTEYELGDVVKYGPSSYICVQGHVSEGDLDDSSIPTNSPPTDTLGVYWDLIASGSETEVLTTTGDLVYYGLTGPTRLPIGTEGQILKVNNGLPSWAYYGIIPQVYYVATTGVDSPAPTYGATIDKPWASVRYATEQILKGPNNPAAQRLLELNRPFIQKEVIQWITWQIANAGGSGIWNGFTYNTTKCERDIGFLIDRVIHDVGHGGNLKMRSAAQTYLNSLVDGPYSNIDDSNGTGTYSNLSVEGDQDIAAFNYMLSLMTDVLNQDAPDVNYQVLNSVPTPVAQFFDATVTAENNVIATVTDLVGIVTSALASGDPSTLPAREVPNYTINVKTGVYRETFPIVVPAETAIVGDELRSTNVGPSDSLIDITDSYYSVRTFDHINDVVGKIVAGTTVTPTSGNTETQSKVAPLASATETSTVSKLIDVMKHQADWRLNTMNSATLTDPTGYNTSYLTGYGDARKLIKENKKFFQAEVIKYMENNYPTLKYSKTRTKRDVGYVVDAIIYDLTYGGNALSVKAGLAYYDGDDASLPQIPGSITTPTLNALTYLRSIMMSASTNTTITPLQTAIPQYRDTAGSAGASTFIGNNVNVVTTIISAGPAAVGTSVTLSDPSTAWVAGALTTAWSTLNSALTTIKNNVSTYLTTNYPGLLSVAQLDKAKRDAEIVLKAVGYDFMFNSNYQTIKAAHAYLRLTSSELFSTSTAIKTATRNSLEYARTQAIANVGGDSTAISRINTNMGIVDSIFFGGSNNGNICQTETANNYSASIQLERNRNFIVAEVEAYIANTFKDTATNTTVTTNVITISSTSWLRRNTAIRFTGTTFGNINTGTTYYVQKIVSSTTFTVALTRFATDAQQVSLSTASGSMGVAFYYNSDFCLRDVGTYVDALKYDLKYEGNYKSRYVARYYANAVLGSLEEDMYYVRNGTGIRNQTLQGLTGQLNPSNSYGTSRPTAGAYVSLDPGYGPDDFTTWIISRSPYVQNVTTFGTGATGLKVDGALHAGGNDSIVANDFTQVISDGIGAWVTNLGRSELVSVFTYYSHVGYLSETGGKIRGTNGNNSYGDFGSVAEGVSSLETPITAVVDNQAFEALSANVFTSGTSVYRVEFLNAGQEYSSGTFAISGAGLNAAAVGNELRDNGIYEVRIVDPGDSSTPGGSNYVTISNNAQGGNTTSISLAATDTAASGDYVGMRLFIVSGTGAGQFGYIQAYNSGSKAATIYKESTGTAGWDHVVPGTSIAAALDLTSVYVIEPRLTFTSPGFTSTARTLPASSTWKDLTYNSGTLSYTNVTSTGGSGSGATFNVVKYNGVYKVSINSRGINYTVGNTLTIAGANVGGTTPTNNITVTLTEVFQGKVQSFTTSGTATGGLFVAIQSGSNNTGVSTNGTSWSAGGTLPASTTWVKIASGVISSNTFYVAVASGGTQASYSITDGATWVSSTLSASATWADVAFGDSRFVAIASGSNVTSISTNGSTWSAGGNLPSSTTWVSLAYGMGMWVAIASGGTVAASSSDNGVTWITRTLPSSSSWTDVTFGNGRFVAVSSGGTAAAYSLNGTTWTAATLPASSSWSHIGYGHGLFFAVSTSGTQGGTSEDGITWTSRTMSTSANGYQSIEFGNPSNSGIWAAIGGSAGTVGSSVVTGATTKARAKVNSDGYLNEVWIVEPGSGYSTAPTMTITDPNNTVEASYVARKGTGVLANPTFTNRGSGYTTASATITGDGYADFFQTGSYVYVKNLTEQPVPGSNVTFSSIGDVYYKLVTVTQFVGSGPYTARLQLSPAMGNAEAPAHNEAVTIRIKYSQVRLTGHDFLDVGTGNFTNTNYPGLPLIEPNKDKETNNFGGGRVFFTSTDQDGNFNVGDLFNVEQSTGVATLNADAFNIAGLNELTLGAVSLGGTGATITEFSTDPTFAANSDSIIPTQRAIKAYITSQIGGGGGSLNVNTVTAGVIYIAGQSISTTTGVQININNKVNFTGGIDGSPLAMNFLLLN